MTRPLYPSDAPATQREYGRRYRERHRQRLQERQRQWQREHPDKVAEYARTYHARSGYEAQRRQALIHPERAKARAALNYEVRKGRMTRQPCEVCGATERVEAHHDDYGKPLEVRWLCRPHHRALERRLVDKMVRA